MPSQPDDTLASLLREGEALAAGRSHARRAHASASRSSATRSPERHDHPPVERRDHQHEDHQYGDHQYEDHQHGDHQYDGGPLRGRPASSLQRTWIDPTEMPFTPVPRPGSPLVSRALSLSASMMVLALLGWLIIPEVSHRLTSIRTVVLQDGVLSAQAVQVSPASPAIVRELFVDAADLPDADLPAGTPIARIEGLSRDGLTNESSILSVPFDARFASVDLLEGGVTYPGAPVATVYDPRRMFVIMTVRTETLELLKRGMRAKLTSNVLSKPISGTVISAVPLLGTDHQPSTAKLVNIRIKPDVERMAQLVPGVRFNAVIDLSSAPKNAPRLVFSSLDGPRTTPKEQTTPVRGSTVRGSTVRNTTVRDSTVRGTTTSTTTAGASETADAPTG